ncbi:putative bifunctional diguanylate cyclase/phosphodiesterase [Neptuniibacter halophilus]|uniref:putative bifunctional diguanylate cyclase/phosphodiesterase n=1 Tax=Neptuniibacter halophilus TaxID=651666 RepID=UPI002573CEEE|nr:EAL domain-containing protein [Neptuniibacter halophilus]
MLSNPEPRLPDTLPAEHLLQSITQGMPGAVYQYRLQPDLSQHFTYISPGIEQISGIHAKDATRDFGLFLKQIHPEDQAGFWASIIHASQHSVAWHYEFRLFHRNGELRWIRGSSMPEQPLQQNPIWNGVLLDITPEKATIEQLRLAGIAFSSTSEGILIADRHNQIIDINRAYSRISGYSREELIGQTPALLRSDRHDEAFFQSIWQALEQHGHWQGEIWNRRKNGEVVPHWVNINAVFDPVSTELTHFVNVIADLSNIKASEARLSHLAHHDPLTGLPNRLLFAIRLEHALEQRQPDEQIQILHLDLDRFNHINDSLGHRYGDDLLLQVSERLNRILRPQDTLARLGGDEFAILLSNNPEAARIAREIGSALEQPFRLGEKEFFSSASIGIATAPEHGEDLETLSKHADIALNQVKASGRNHYAFFQPEQCARLEAWVELEPALRRALDEGQLRLHYQPQIESRTGRITGAEALVRWQHPEQGLIMPDQFLPIAEEIGLMQRLGDWVLEEALKQLAEWRAQGYSDLKVSVNLASAQITGPELPDRVAGLLKTYQIPPQQLELEILETFLMEHEQAATLTFSRLRQLGVELALDDFGTGYSALSYLKKLPLTKVKMDRSLVRDIPLDSDDEAIARAVILLSHTLGLTTCAEGVENPEQQAFLTEQGCDQLQGYLFSKPLDARSFRALLLKEQLPPLAC